MISGAVISGLIGWFFAWQGSRQLADTHRQVALLLHALDAGDVIELNRNDAGEPIGVVIRLSGVSFGTSNTTAELAVEPAPPANPRRSG
jgi:hypothetical protein